MFDHTPRVSHLPLISLTALTMVIAGCDDSTTDPISLSNQCIVTPSGASFTGALGDGITAGSATRYNVTANPTLGTLSYDQSDGGYTYTPTTQSRGYRDSFTVEVTGSEDGTASATVDIIYGAARIMPLGDSITFGVTSSQGTVATDLPLAADAVGYRQALYELLEDGDYSFDFVGHENAGGSAGLTDTDHAGTPGATAAVLAAGTNGWLTASPADIVLLHAGTNDINSGGTSAAGIQSILSAIDTWGQQAANPNATAVVARIVPSPDATKNGRINSFNASLDGIMSVNWPDLEVVDMNAALTAATDMTPLVTDTTGLHPNTSGYAKMATSWFDALVSSNAINKCAS